MSDIYPQFKTELKQIPRGSPFRAFRRTAARLQRSDVSSGRARKGARGMRPNYGNKRVYLEGEEKYHFPGGENGEERRPAEGQAGANEGE